MGKHIPAFADCRVREQFAGSLMTTLDNLGVVLFVENIPGLYIDAGMRYGLTMSAAAGEALADMITGTACKTDIAPCRYERPVDNSEFVFHP